MATDQVTDLYQMYLGDCIPTIGKLPPDSIDFTIFSPPFSQLYIYSDSEADMGNCGDDEEFFDHFGYLVPELMRVTVPGRLVAVHCKDLPLYRNRDGDPGLRDFPGQLIAAMEKGGFVFHSRCTIWKCPVTERERTNNNGLLHKTVRRDSSQLRSGMADYLILFRRTPSGDDNLSAKPIVRGKGFTRYIGEPQYDPALNNYHPSPFARRNRSVDPEFGLSIDIWRRYAEPVWWDIDQMDVLNVELARGAKDERHICPLQLGVAERAIEIWSDIGDIVLCPFAGIGSEGYQAVKQGRRFVGVELKPSYYEIACRNLATAATSIQHPLFDYAT